MWVCHVVEGFPRLQCRSTGRLNRKRWHCLPCSMQLEMPTFFVQSRSDFEHVFITWLQHYYAYIIPELFGVLDMIVEAVGPFQKVAPFGHTEKKACAS